MDEHIEDWTSLTGQFIWIRRNGRHIRFGEVETVSPSGDALWLSRQGVEPRALYEKAEGYKAWRVAEQSILDAPIDHFSLI